MSVESQTAKRTMAIDFELADAKTIADEVYIRLRRDIIAGRLPADERLRLETLKTGYGVGLSPLREALSRLASENLVTLVGQRGFSVAPVSLSELHDICRLRIMLETTALRDSIAHGTVDWEARIVAALHRLLNTRLPGGSDQAVDEWEMRHSDFHASLIEACNSPWLLKLCHSMTLQYERYRRRVITGMTLSEELYAEVEAEHRTLSEAVLARDADRSAALLADHFHHVVQLIQSSYEQ
jgi:GntR family carbon starvation induced transcriptional regulator